MIAQKEKRLELKGKPMMKPSVATIVEPIWAGVVGRWPLSRSPGRPTKTEGGRTKVQLAMSNSILGARVTLCSNERGKSKKREGGWANT